MCTQTSLEFINSSIWKTLPFERPGMTVVQLLAQSLYVYQLSCNLIHVLVNMHPICAINLAWPVLRFIPVATEQYQPPLPTQTSPSVQQLHLYPSVSDPYWQIDKNLVENEVDCMDTGNVEVVVAKIANAIQGVQEPVVSHMMTLVHRVYENEGQSEKSNQ